MLKNVINWQIVPYEGVGELRLGDSRADIRSFLDEDCITLPSWGSARNDIDAYDKACIQLHYDKDDLLVFIEINPPYNPLFREIELMGLPLQSAIKQMQALGYQEKFDDASSCRFNDVGIALYAPMPRIITAVSIYKRGLYEESI